MLMYYFDALGNTIRLYVPEFCLLECANVIWKQIRFNNLTIMEAESLVDDLIKLPLTIVPAKRLLKRAVQIGANSQLAVYDSVYIVLAEMQSIALITTDLRQENAAKALGVLVKPLTDFQ